MQKLFENWRNFKQEALEEAAALRHPMVKRIAQQGMKLFQKYGRMIKGPKIKGRGAPQQLSPPGIPGPRSVGQIKIEYGPFLNKIMGDAAPALIKFFAH
jgi:hypothetical protein